ncbi:MuF-C-terminal domain-containing protein [Capnocytophaga canis]|uniref:MuF-C-terminal domain-containing protein n=1 Tax=Capnocytophaga canis TaxID=1848903 RepID=UPI0037CF9B18
MLPPKSNEKRKKVYDFLSQNFDVGTFNEFSVNLNDPNKRKKAYDFISKSHDAGTFDEFSSDLGYSKKKENSVGAEDSTASNGANGLSGYPEANKTIPLTENQRQRLKAENLQHSFEQRLPASELVEKFESATALTPDDEQTIRNNVTEKMQDGFFGSLFENIHAHASFIGKAMGMPLLDKIDGKTYRTKMMLQARDVLNQENADLNEKAIEQRAFDLALAQERSNFQQQKKIKYLENLSENEKKQLEIDQLYHMETLDLKEKSHMAEREIQLKKLKEQRGRVKSAIALAKQYQSEGKQIPESVALQIQDMMLQEEKLVETAQALNNVLSENINKRIDQHEALSLIKRDYSIMGMLGKDLLEAGMQINKGILGAGHYLHTMPKKAVASIFLNKEEYATYEKQLDTPFARDIAEIDDNLAIYSEQFAPKITSDNIKNFKDLGFFIAQETTSQVPTLATTILPAGAWIMGATSAGSKSADLTVEEFRSGINKYNFLQELVAPATIGATEKFLGSDPTKTILKRSVTPHGRRLLKEGVGKYMKEMVKDNAEEVITETLTTLSENLVDIYMLGDEDKFITDGLSSTALSTLASMPVIIGTGRLAGSAIKWVTPKEDIELLRKNMQRIEILSKALENAETPSRKQEIINDIKKEESKNDAILQGIEAKLKGIDENQIKEIQQITFRQAQLQTQARNTDNYKGLTKGEKESLIAPMKQEFTELENKRQTILSGLRRQSDSNIDHEEKNETNTDTGSNTTNTEVNVHTDENLPNNQSSPDNVETSVSSTETDTEPHSSKTDTEQNIENTKDEPKNKFIPPEIKVKKSSNSFTYQAKFEDGKIAFKAPNGASVSDQTQRVLQTKYAEKVNFNQGNEALGDTIDEIALSENPSQIASTLLSLSENEYHKQLDYKQRAIAEHLGKIEPDSFYHFGDRKQVTGSLAITYFSKKGKGQQLDVLAQEISGIYGVEITEQDIVDFMVDNPRGSTDFLSRNFKEDKKILEGRFMELTGLPASKKILQIAQKQRTASEHNSKTSNAQKSNLDNTKQKSDFEDITNKRNDVYTKPNTASAFYNPDDKWDDVPFQNTNNRGKRSKKSFVKIPRKAFDRLIEKLKKGFPNVKVNIVSEKQIAQIVGQNWKKRQQHQFLDRVNDRFNNELHQMINGSLPTGHIFQLGRPNAILQSAGIPNLPIEMSSARLKTKAIQENHQFDLSEVENLPEAIQNPIGIFAYGDKSKSVNIITELQDKNGKKYLVGIHFNQNRDGLEVNSIRGIFPKDNAEWLNWINQGKSLYLDKKKVQDLITQQQTNLADVSYLDLNSTAKVVKNFENPKINNEINFHIGAKARLTYEQQIRKKNPNISEEHLQESLDFLHSLEDNKENAKAIKVAIKWLETDAIRLPFAMENVRTAIELAEKHKIDPMQFKSPMDIINKYFVDVEYGKEIDTDKIPQFTNKRIIGEGENEVVVYDVEDSEAGQRAVTKICHQHFGYSNQNKGSKQPWCLASFTRKGEPTESAKNYWFNTYNSVGKKIAFQWKDSGTKTEREKTECSFFHFVFWLSETIDNNDRINEIYEELKQNNAFIFKGEGINSTFTASDNFENALNNIKATHKEKSAVLDLMLPPPIKHKKAGLVPIAFMAHDKDYEGDLWWDLEDSPSNNLPLPNGDYLDPDGSISDKKGDNEDPDDLDRYYDDAIQNVIYDMGNSSWNGVLDWLYGEVNYNGNRSMQTSRIFEDTYDDIYEKANDLLKEEIQVKINDGDFDTELENKITQHKENNEYTEEDELSDNELEEIKQELADELFDDYQNNSELEELWYEFENQVKEEELYDYRYSDYQKRMILEDYMQHHTDGWEYSDQVRAEQERLWQEDGGGYTDLQFFNDKQGNILGFVKDGQIYINNDSGINANTPIHEFGHLWVNVLKQQNKPLYDKVIQTIMNDKKAVEQMRNNKHYAHLKTNEQVAEEILATAIGNYGEQQFLDNQNLTPLQRLVKDIMQWLKEFIGKGNSIAKWSDEKWQKATIGDVANAISEDLLRGKQVPKNKNKQLYLKMQSARKISKMSDQQIKELLSRMKLIEPAKCP